MKVSGPHHDAAGGVHRLPVPHGMSGVLLACAFDVVGPDPEAVMTEFSVDTVVCLMESEEVDRRFPSYAGWLTAATGPGRAVHAPAPDHGVVADDPAAAVAADVVGRLESGMTVLLHCGGGYGRTGVVAVQVLASSGMGLEESLVAVRAARPACGPQSDTQDDQLHRLVGAAGRTGRTGETDRTGHTGVQGDTAGAVL
jgi:hypothetical protein